MRKLLAWLEDDEGAHDHKAIGYAVLAALIVTITKVAFVFLDDKSPMPGEFGLMLDTNLITFFEMVIARPVIAGVFETILPLVALYFLFWLRPTIIFNLAMGYALFFTAIDYPSGYHMVITLVTMVTFSLLAMKCGGLEGRFIKMTICVTLGYCVSSALTAMSLIVWRFVC